MVTELCTGGNIGELDPQVDDWDEIRLGEFLRGSGRVVFCFCLGSLCVSDDFFLWFCDVC